MNAGLQAKEIRVHYGKMEAIKDISMEIGEKEVVCLLGSNGAGKTTVLKAISGLKRITSGEIWFKGKRIDKNEPHDIVKSGITQVPEGSRLFLNMSVYENLLMGAFLRRDKEEIKKSLEEIYKHFPGLRERLKQRAKFLSGGEQKMLAIGRSLMCDPKLLILDEPSIGLSPLMISEIEKIIRDIRRLGITIFLVEQNCRLAFRLSERAYVMETGLIVLQGKIVDLENNDYIKKAYLGG